MLSAAQRTNEEAPMKEGGRQRRRFSSIEALVKGRCSLSLSSSDVQFLVTDFSFSSELLGFKHMFIAPVVVDGVVVGSRPPNDSLSPGQGIR